jgi:hypothetical protein
MLLPELERCRHIGGIDAAGDRRGPAVDQQVEAESCPLVFPIGRAEHVTDSDPRSSSRAEATWAAYASSPAEREWSLTWIA